MKVLIQLALCSTLLMGGAMAQHRGGGGGGGGSRGSAGGFSRGGGFGSAGHSGFIGGGGIGSSAFRGGGGFNGFRGGVGFNGFRGGFGFNRGFGFGFGGFGWPYYGYGYGLGYGYGYGYSPYDSYYDPYYTPYSYYPDNSYSYQAYQSSPNVTMVYPPQQQAGAAYGGNPGMRGYDQYGQQVRSSGGSDEASSPIYLIAMKNHNIYAASSYSVNGDTLHYVTLEHAEKQVPLDAVDRDLTQRLNRERRVGIHLSSEQ